MHTTWFLLACDRWWHDTAATMPVNHLTLICPSPNLISWAHHHLRSFLSFIISDNGFYGPTLFFSSYFKLSILPSAEMESLSTHLTNTSALVFIRRFCSQLFWAKRSPNWVVKGWPFFFLFSFVALQGLPISLYYQWKRQKPTSMTQHQRRVSLWFAYLSKLSTCGCGEKGEWLSQWN